jgi:NitT/TauT family transport system ATP-binding protein
VTGTEGKRISYLFQEPRLLPGKRFWGTSSSSLEKQCQKRKKGQDKAFLSLVGLPVQRSSTHACFRWYASANRHRRAFSFPSEIILMDEPFQALDLNLKVSLLKAFVPCGKRRAGQPSRDP